MIHRRLAGGNAAAVNRRDISAMQRRLRTTGAQTRQEADTEPLEAIFSHAGTPTTDESGPWFPRRTATLKTAIAGLGTAGSTATIVTVYVNGGSQGTITIASGQTKGIAAFDDVLVADTDYLTVAATTVGAGAANLTVQARLT